MRKPKVSIVTPSYNQVQFLEETMRSVINQTYPNVEYIVVDGGSTDGSVEIIKRYNDRIASWVSEKDRGQSEAINKGFEKSSGEIIAYLNSDDVLEPDAVEKIVEVFERYPDAAVVYGQCSTIDEQSRIIHPPQGAVAEYYWLLKTGMLPRMYQPACFFNRSLINRKPMLRDELHYVMDYELILHLLQTHPSCFVKHPVARYRVHPHAKTSRQSSSLYMEKLSVQREYGVINPGKVLKHRIKTLLFRS